MESDDWMGPGPVATPTLSVPELFVNLVFHHQKNNNKKSNSSQIIKISFGLGRQVFHYATSSKFYLKQKRVRPKLRSFASGFRGTFIIVAASTKSFRAAPSFEIIQHKSFRFTLSIYLSLAIFLYHLSCKNETDLNFSSKENRIRIYLKITEICKSGSPPLTPPPLLLLPFALTSLQLKVRNE